MSDQLVNIKVEALLGAIRSTGLALFEEAEVERREGRYSAIPERLHPALKLWLEKNYNGELYAHQAEALRQFVEGQDICIATPTASGKSLIFISAALHLLLSDPFAKVVAFYPAKALIRDQMAKWTEACAEFGLAPGYIDGSVQSALREGILQRHRIILMTPDVAHAWLMAKLSQPIIRGFLSNVRLLVMDEAHVYDGVFGTNMAFFLRRMFAVSDIQHIITSTATIGDPERFIESLTGRCPCLIDSSIDGAPSPSKHIFSLVAERGNFFDNTVGLVKYIAQSGLGRFLVFADSRKTVEQIVSIAARKDDDDENSADDGEGLVHGIFPYRAGYEEEDRAEIQDALASGSLAGVVSTSALELGLDIGDIDIVILLRTPTNIKSFWQRIGRAGRRHEGYVLIINDTKQPVGCRSLHSLLLKPPERGWLYLDNIYIQYTHALCAIQELTDFGEKKYKDSAHSTLPSSFARMLENERTPTEGILPELYPLKQRAQNGPHFEFALRSDSGKNFSVSERHGPNNHSLGSVNYSQALREAYPGAMYYYMAKPYRVTGFSHRTAEISVSRGVRLTTQPLLQNMVFPKVPGGLRACSRSDAGFLMEADVQVNERVIGFKEQQGNRSEQHLYGPDSEYCQRPLVRFFETTGVLWFFSDSHMLSEAVGQFILETFCSVCGIQERDLGVGAFFMRPSQLWSTECTGLCIYDAVPGSLRLSRRLFDDFTEILGFARTFIETEAENALELDVCLARCLERVQEFKPFAVSSFASTADIVSEDPDWVTVLAPNQQAILKNLYGDEEVEVLEYRYTPRGLMYRLATKDPAETRMVPHSSIVSLPGQTILLEANLITGETRQLTS
ncbi:MAG: DEAD/DEAH box helicase [Rectinemataceae bacterium]